MPDPPYILFPLNSHLDPKIIHMKLVTIFIPFTGYNRLSSPSTVHSGLHLGSNTSSPKRAFLDKKLVDPPPWAACAKTLQRLLEQYIDDRNSIQSLTKNTLTGCSLQSMVNGTERKNIDQMTARTPTPPPLLHRPPKRFTEQNQEADITQEPKRPRLQNHRCEDKTKHPRSLLQDKADFRQEMFEKTKSLGNTLRPPPPLLKQDTMDKMVPDLYRTYSQVNLAASMQGQTQGINWKVSTRNNDFSKCGFPVESSNASGRDSEQEDNVGTKKLLSDISPENKSEPVPREITGDTSTSCGGYAFDHTSMPKIIAVHSISKRAEDMDEWERNKAFIHSVKAQQNKQRILEGERKIHVPTTLAKTISSLKTSQESALQYNRGNEEENFLQAVNGNGVAQEEISFERYVLYHLLSKYQGNVEHVRHVLKQNMVQEWLSYCQGNVQPKLQTLSGVSLCEIRKLYEMWCQLRRNGKTNESDENKAQIISDTESMMTSNYTKRIFDSNTAAKNHSNLPLSTQRSENHKLYQEARLSSNQGNWSTRNISSLDDRIPRKSVNSTTIPSNFQGEYKAVSVETVKGNQQTGRSLSQLTTHQSSPESRPLDHVTNVEGKIVPLNFDTKKGSSKIQQLPGALCMSREQVSGQVLGPTREQILREYSEASEGMRHQSSILVQEQERADGTNTASVTLVQICQTNTKLTPFSTECERNASTDLERQFFQAEYQSKNNHLESLRNDNARSNDVKGNYLWRFKDGKLISDSMPCISNGKVIRELDVQKIISGQNKITETKQTSMKSKLGSSAFEPQSDGKASTLTSKLPNEWNCKIDICQSANGIQTVRQEHNKACGAAACGKPCFCVLKTRVGRQGLQSQQSLQRFHNKPRDKSNQDLAHGAQSEKQNFSGLKLTRNEQDTQMCYVRLNEQGIKPPAGLETSSEAKGHEVVTNRAIVSHEQETGLLNVSHKNSSIAKSNQHILTDNSNLIYNVRQADTAAFAKTHIPSRNSGNFNDSAQAHQPSNEDILSKSSSKSNIRPSPGTQITYNSGIVKAIKSPPHSSSKISSSIRNIRPSFSVLYNSDNKDANQESTFCLAVSSNTQTRDFQESNESKEISYHAHPNQPSIKGLCFASKAEIVNSSETVNVSPKLKSSQIPNIELNSENLQRDQLHIQTLSPLQETSQPVSISLVSNKETETQPNACTKQTDSAFTSPSIKGEMNQSSYTVVSAQEHSRKEDQNSSTNLKTLLPIQPVKQPFSSPVLNKRHYFQSTPPTVSDRCDGKEQKQTNSMTKEAKKSYASIHILQPQSTLVRIAPKADLVLKTWSKPISSSDCSPDSAKLKTSPLVKSEMIKETSRSSTPLPAKKPRTSLLQLAKKVSETRQRYSLENIPWKKKILKSLEGVLMKRLRKLEKDTGLKADLVDGVNLEPE